MSRRSRQYGRNNVTTNTRISKLRKAFFPKGKGTSLNAILTKPEFIGTGELKGIGRSQTNIKKLVMGRKAMSEYSRKGTSLNDINFINTQELKGISRGNVYEYAKKQNDLKYAIEKINNKYDFIEKLEDIIEKARNKLDTTTDEDDIIAAQHTIEFRTKEIEKTKKVIYEILLLIRKIKENNQRLDEINKLTEKDLKNGKPINDNSDLMLELKFIIKQIRELHKEIRNIDKPIPKGIKKKSESTLSKLAREGAADISTIFGDAIGATSNAYRGVKYASRHASNMSRKMRNGATKEVTEFIRKKITPRGRQVTSKAHHNTSL